ncbi:MAG: hypothetical protein R2932_37100 [Caldilineaceae bacterium]
MDQGIGRGTSVSLAYPRAFFGFQLSVARQLVERFSLELADVLQQYTTFTRPIATEHLAIYLAGLQAATDATEWAYQWDLVQRAPGPQPNDSMFYNRALFGCFHYSIHNDRAGNATIIRPHFIKNDQAGLRALGRERLAVRRAEVRRMFVHIQEHVPGAKTVRGHSWLYNLNAYRRVYPRAYTTSLPAVQRDEFQYLSMWGQCFDRHWQPNPRVTTELLQRLARLEDITKLRACFPYQVRRPQCAIREIYTALEIDT